ncbi:hypothetical protein Pmani_007268 [Petrolisthes manimaculis]|uniref:Alpha-macroglobulin-like TED domain-containing protein n=1 Tax=Petrolisthes manimaculis TaxID=1843537 RepID=A0AAE1Q9A0_9EUCA|nr:hypothetical protein Pmani_007268 [Petrolisthes manimaculis]
MMTAYLLAFHFDAVDTDQLKETTDWLLHLQGTQDGCFEAVGKLINKQMQGGINSGNAVSLTAYVMAALLEAETPTDDPIVSRAALCLTNDTSTHPYTLATKAYALALASHPNATSLMQKLLSQAVVTKNAMYWNLPKGRTSNSRAASLETAGYTILAMMTHDPKTNEEKARKIVKWITAQRNGQGGFYSTQGAVWWWKESLRLPTQTSGLDCRIRRLRNITPWPNLLKTRSHSWSGHGCSSTQADVATAPKLGTAFLPGLHNGHRHEWLCQYSVHITTIRFTEVLVDTPPSSTSPTPPISVSTSPQSPTPESSTAAMEVASKTPTHNVGCGEWTSWSMCYVLPLLFTSVG